MKIKMHGAAREVGRSCIEVKSADGNFLFDCGLKITPNGSVYPENIEGIQDIDAVFLSHAHLDHNGALPLFFEAGLTCPIYCTKMTKLLSRILLLDSYKIERLNGNSPYEKEAITDVLANMNLVKYDRAQSEGNLKFTYYDAGHIPGSASIIVETEGKKIMYSGDIKLEDTALIDGAKYDHLPQSDVLIIESAYGDRKHPNREEQINRFLDKIQETIENGGSVVIPVFGVGRAQEIALILKKRKWNVPIYLDGMAKKVTITFLKNREFLKDAEQLNNALKNIFFVNGIEERKSIVQKQGIFLSTSGMMNGGPIIEYLKHIAKDSKNAILLTGFQTEETNGRHLLDSGIVYVDDEEIKVNAYYEKFDFSAHAGMTELHETIKKANPKLVILNHGDPSSEDAMLQWCKENGFNAVAPKLNEEIEF